MSLQYEILHDRKLVEADLQQLRLAISDANLELLPDYEQRVDVLKELQFIDQNSTVLLKGRVACEINSSDELVLTELILDNTLARFTPEEAVALLSVFVFVEKTESVPEIAVNMQEGLHTIYEIADRIERVQDSNKVAHDDFRTKYKPGLVEVVYEWAKGMVSHPRLNAMNIRADMSSPFQPFNQITDLTDVPEGTIVRVITRLDETCREVRDAARVVGDRELFTKMEQAQAMIKRDSESDLNRAKRLLMSGLFASRICRQSLLLEAGDIDMEIAYPLHDSPFSLRRCINDDMWRPAAHHFRIAHEHCVYVLHRCMMLHNDPYGRGS